MTRIHRNVRSAALAGVAAAALLATTASAQMAEIVLGNMIFPESIAAAPDGALLVGSFTQGTVFRVAPGGTTAEPWLTGLGPIITGVFVHEDTVYVCSNGAFGSNEATLKTFDLATAAETGSYPFPDGGFCSDIAVAPDGTVYVTHLNFTGAGDGRLLRLANGALEVVLADAALAGLDGIAFLGDTLIVNDLLTGALYRVDTAASPATYTALTLSAPLMGPDGMRTTEDGTALLIVEQYANRLVRVNVEGDTGTVTEIATGFAGPAGVATFGEMAYVVEAHFDAMQAGTDPGVFVIKAVPLGM